MKMKGEIAPTVSTCDKIHVVPGLKSIQREMIKNQGFIRNLGLW